MTSSPSPELVIQPATVDRLDDLSAIEQACFSDPWTRKMLQAELSGNQFARFLLATYPDASVGTAIIAGYVCYWVVFDELRLMNLAVLEAFRRRDVATTLICAALQGGAAEGATKALLEVRASNQAARRLYETLGFRESAVRRRYYAKPDEDAVLMDLIPLTAPPCGGDRARAEPKPDDGQSVC